MTICCDNILTANMEIKKKVKKVLRRYFPQKKKNASETVWLNKSNSLLLLLCTLILFIYRIVEMITLVNKGAKNKLSYSHLGQLRSKLYVSYL